MTQVYFSTPSAGIASPSLSDGGTPLPADPESRAVALLPFALLVEVRRKLTEAQRTLSTLS